jgi:hypothetical protein
VQGSIDYGFAAANWSVHGLPDGEYELVLHVVCEASGLSFPPAGIDDYYSSPVRGVCWFHALFPHSPDDRSRPVGSGACGNPPVTRRVSPRRRCLCNVEQ